MAALPGDFVCMPVTPLHCTACRYCPPLYNTVFIAGYPVWVANVSANETFGQTTGDIVLRCEAYAAQVSRQGRHFPYTVPKLAIFYR